MLINTIKNDLYRYAGNTSIKSFIKYYFFSSFQYIVWFRIASRFPNIFLKYIVYRKSLKFCIQIPVGTYIGSGLYITHFGGIVVNRQAKIGLNCDLSHNVTIGKHNGKTPIIGNNVFIGPGAIIMGDVTIGDNAAIGANAVVTKNVPTNSVVVGIPAKVISQDGRKRNIKNILNNFQ